MTKVTGTYDERSARIGFHEWSLMEYPTERLAAIINAVVRDAMDIATAGYTCSAWFPAEYHPSDGVSRKRKAPDDPTTIFVELPLGPNEDESPRWSFTLQELVESAIELVEAGEGGPITAPRERANLKRIRDRLAEHVAALDAALARGDK